MLFSSLIRFFCTGQILLNGQLVSGLSRDSASSPTTHAPNRNSGPTPPLIGAHSSPNLHMPPSPIDSVSSNCLNALLNGSVSRSMSPHPDGSMMNGGGLASGES